MRYKDTNNPLAAPSKNWQGTKRLQSQTIARASAFYERTRARAHRGRCVRTHSFWCPIQYSRSVTWFPGMGGTKELRRTSRCHAVFGLKELLTYAKACDTGCRSQTILEQVRLKPKHGGDSCDESSPLRRPRPRSWMDRGVTGASNEQERYSRRAKV